MQPTLSPETEVQLERRPDGGPPPGPAVAAAVVAVALLVLAATSPALALVGFFAGGVCLGAVLDRR